MGNLLKNMNRVIYIFFYSSYFFAASLSTCPDVTDLPIFGPDGTSYLAAWSWPGYGENACQETDENHGPWFQDPCEKKDVWISGDNMTDFFTWGLENGEEEACTTQIKSMVIRPGCKADLFYGFDYSGIERVYESGVYHNVGPVMDVQCEEMYGYHDMLCPPVSAKFSCEMSL